MMASYEFLTAHGLAAIEADDTPPPEAWECMTICTEEPEPDPDALVISFAELREDPRRTLARLRTWLRRGPGR